MYETLHEGSQKGRGKINYTVWSDVFICSNCTGEIIFWDSAVDLDQGQVKEEFPCPHCSVLQTKRTASKAYVTQFDEIINEVCNQIKMVPVLINYSFNGKRFKKTPDSEDFNILRKIDEINLSSLLVANKLEPGDKTSDPYNKEIYYAHQFYYKRELYWLISLFAKAKGNFKLTWLIISIANTLTKMYRYVPKKPNYNGQGGGMLSGTLYVPSLIRSLSATSCLERSISRLARASFISDYNSITNSVNSATTLLIEEKSIDYIFTDPPFGANLMYSELNFIWENWLKVKTNNSKEAIENKSQGKTLIDYQRLCCMAR